METGRTRSGATHAKGGKKLSIKRRERPRRLSGTKTSPSTVRSAERNGAPLIFIATRQGRTDCREYRGALAATESAAIRMRIERNGQDSFPRFSDRSLRQIDRSVDRSRISKFAISPREEPDELSARQREIPHAHLIRAEMKCRGGVFTREQSRLFVPCRSVALERRVSARRPAPTRRSNYN